VAQQERSHSSDRYLMLSRTHNDPVSDSKLEPRSHEIVEICVLQARGEVLPLYDEGVVVAAEEDSTSICHLRPSHPC